MGRGDAGTHARPRAGCRFWGHWHSGAAVSLGFKFGPLPAVLRLRRPGPIRLSSGGSGPRA
eukprot:5776354-Lingulodinium_polyedra.AAC.1